MIGGAAGVAGHAPVTFASVSHGPGCSRRSGFPPPGHKEEPMLTTLAHAPDPDDLAEFYFEAPVLALPADPDTVEEAEQGEP